MARLVVGWSIVDLDIGLKGAVLHSIAIEIRASGLGNTKDDIRIDLRLPPDGRHRTCDRCTDDLTDAKVLVDPGETMTVAVVPLADEDTARLRPLHEGVIADVLPTWGEALVELTAEQEGEVLVEPAPTIVAGVDDHSVIVAVLTEELLVGFTEAVAIHRTYDDVGYTATTELLYKLFTLLLPATEEELLLGRLADGADKLFKALARLRIVEGDAGALADLTVEIELDGLIRRDRFAIDLLDDHTGVDLVAEV